MMMMRMVIIGYYILEISVLLLIFQVLVVINCFSIEILLIKCYYNFKL